MSHDKPFLCLNMIVKNESKIIKRLLDSVVSIIDSYCICDTGSTDNTIEIIRQYFQSKNIPGEVFEIPFRDFGYNRTKALERAKNWGQYALLLDADMILEISPKFKKSDIVLDAYHVKQKNSVLDYYNTRIVRTDRDITCVGVTHEYYNIPPCCKHARLDTLEINDVGDGGCKSDKFERDIRLLRKGLLDEPKNERYCFYLANSYRDLGTVTGNHSYLQKAIKWYKKRLEMGGWDEELFMCCLEIGNICLKIKEPERAVYWWIEAWMHRKTRAESLYQIIKYYREKDARHAYLAAHFYNIAKNIPYPSQDQLFIQKAVYDYLLDYEYSILAYYMGWSIDYYRYLNLLGKHENYENILSNYKFYVKPLSTLRPFRLQFNTIATIDNHRDTFRSSTPSIIPFKQGYLMNQRYVNYFIEPNGSYTCNYPITSWNRQLYLDRNFKMIEQFDFDQLPTKVDKYAGIEDVKIFPFNDEIWFFGTEQDLETKNLCVTTGLYPTDHNTHYLKSQIIKSPTNNQCEKNWAYLADSDGKLRVIYQWSPLTIGHIDQGQLIIDLKDSQMPAFARHLRGSTHGQTVNDEIWFLTHLVEYVSPRNYYHCIIILDARTLKYKRHSILFKFEDSPIEYCLGMIIEPRRVIFSYSKMDRESILTVFDRPTIEHFLFPVSSN